ncbi:chromatin/chromatin-binding, or -regulatory protein [Lithospermum erythrorhizon]|uniref:Chromatin/chromatin-binding, or -regulatory protein n=1 Tax=Lithospermum erythrorhizon TaxID=34254 RepID=A0AAV3P110_LITER
MGLPVEIKLFMHGFIQGPIIVVNAQVDSMGGVFDRGACVGRRTYPQLASIEEVQAELRLEYNVREERRRELEFLQKGGEPLEFKLRNAVSLSVQSTSVTDQHPDQLVNSERKGSIACTTSPHGNSVGSSGRPEVHPLPEPNCTDSLLLFCGESEAPDGNLLHPSTSSLTPSELSTQLDGPVNAIDKKDSISCSLLRMAYKRRSRPNHDLSSCHAPRDVKRIVPYIEIQKDLHVSMDFNPTPLCPNRGTICKSSYYSLEFYAINEAAESMADQLQGFSESASDANAFKDLTKDHDNGKTAVIDQRGGELVSKDQEKCLDHSDLECVAHMETTKVEDHANSSQKGGISGSKEDEKALHVIVHSNKTKVATKLLDSESSCTFMNRNIYGCSDNEMLTNQKQVDSNGDVEKQTLVHEVTSLKEATELEEEKKQTQPDLSAILNEDNDLTYRNCQGNGFVSLSDEESNRNALHFKNAVKGQVAVESVQAGADIEREKNSDSRKTGISVSYAETAPLMVNLSNKSSILELPECAQSVKNTAVTVETKERNVIATSKADEDAILKEAHAIQAKRKRVTELNATTFHIKNHKRSHWNYVLEEMAWLANDFAQERLWKMTAAAQLCHRVADTSLLTYQEKHFHKEKRKVAHVLSKAVMKFWNSVQKANKGMDLACQKDSACTIWEYAKRFIKFNSSNIPDTQTTSPANTDRVGHLRTMDTSQEDSWTELEGSIFYQGPFNGMEAYRELIESHLKIGNSLREGETSACDVTDIGLIENRYEEAKEETSFYNYDISRSSKFAQKKRRIMIGYDIEPQNVGTDLMHTQFFENKHVVKQSDLVGKRPASNLNVSIPTKRVRTASRQRVLSPYTAGTFGCVPLPIKAEALNADTSCFHEDLDGQPIMPNGLEVEPGGDFVKSFPLDSTEVHMPKMKKKASAHEQKRQVDSNFHSEQKDQSRKRPEGQPLESNGLSVQHILKMPNSMMPSARDNNFDNIGPVTGSIPSLVTPQMNNMSNTNKLFKILSGGDQSRKDKLSNVPTRQQGSGVPWSLFEDQALVVLVHDIGLNWELVSHTINSTLKFKVNA